MGVCCARRASPIVAEGLLSSLPMMHHGVLHEEQNAIADGDDREDCFQRDWVAATAQVGREAGAGESAIERSCLASPSGR